MQGGEWASVTGRSGGFRTGAVNGAKKTTVLADRLAQPTPYLYTHVRNGTRWPPDNGPPASHRPLQLYFVDSYLAGLKNKTLFYSLADHCFLCDMFIPLLPMSTTSLCQGYAIAIGIITSRPAVRVLHNNIDAGAFLFRL